MNFDDIMALEPHGPDTYVGIGPQYPWGGLYGGQILAQALRAASATVDPAYRVHSLHAYFIRLGDQDQPVRYEVDRIRDGRSYLTRLVVARQPVGAILNLSASFQMSEAGHAVQTAQMSPSPNPDELASDAWTPIFDRRHVERGSNPGTCAAWLRMNDAVDDDPVLHACALAYISDDLPTEAVVLQHPERPPLPSENWPFWSASLDHAIWFHRPFRADQWHLHHFTCHGFMSSRGLALGNVFTQTGDHVATVAQEVLLRARRENTVV